MISDVHASVTGWREKRGGMALLSFYRSPAQCSHTRGLPMRGTGPKHTFTKEKCSPDWPQTLPVAEEDLKNFWIFYLCFPLAGITSMYHHTSANGIRASSQGSAGAREALYQLSATSDLQSTLVNTVSIENPLRCPVLTPVSDVPPGLPLELLSLQWWSLGLFSALLTHGLSHTCPLSISI